MRVSIVDLGFRGPATRLETDKARTLSPAGYGASPGGGGGSRLGFRAPSLKRGENPLVSECVFRAAT